ncbi:MAG: hypothetical protein P8N31_11065 [Planctomycetota bacterium]|nr:hypothetical protein [Planctomycetota bacterium]MDG2144086.1 hypothetical protein [Planctomycetota bacterium]
MNLTKAAKRAPWAAQGLAAALIFGGPLAYGSQDQTHVLDVIQRYRGDRDFGAAMGAASELQPPGFRAHHEAMILYSARSYGAALLKAMEAIHLGDRDELLLLTSVRAAIWVRDSESASFCQQLLGDRVDAMEVDNLANHAWYRDESAKAAQHFEDLIASDRAIEEAIRKSKLVSLAALGAALAGLYLARTRSH